MTVKFFSGSLDLGYEKDLGSIHLVYVMGHPCTSSDYPRLPLLSEITGR